MPADAAFAGNDGRASGTFTLDSGVLALASLIQDRFSPARIVSVKGATCPGIEKAKRRALEQRGWRVAALPVAQWQALGVREAAKLQLLTSLLDAVQQ